MVLNNGDGVESGRWMGGGGGNACWVTLETTVIESSTKGQTKRLQTLHLIGRSLLEENRAGRARRRKDKPKLDFSATSHRVKAVTKDAGFHAASAGRR